jgi:hypothetical protein
MNKTLILPGLAILMLAAGCMSSTMITNTDPFQYNYTPVANTKLSDPEAAFEALVDLLEAEGYMVAANAAFLTATTFPRQLGYIYWRANREKWDVSCQAGVQIIITTGDRLYWNLTHRIIGRRTMSEDRLFEPADFEETEMIFNDLALKITRLFSSEA